VRLEGVASALGYDPGRLEVVLYQLVHLLSGGKPLKMSKRTGDLVVLDDVLDEVGADATRFTMLTFSSDSVVNFDVEEARKQSLDNPVYYVQYAHARIASIMRKAQETGFAMKPVEDVDLRLLSADSEIELLKSLAGIPRLIATAAELRAPHRLTHASQDVAACFHRFYAECRVVSEDEALTQARLVLVSGTKSVLGVLLGLLGVSAPERMERIDDD
jgi:arginyl-tRNA synthetase